MRVRIRSPRIIERPFSTKGGAAPIQIEEPATRVRPSITGATDIHAAKLPAFSPPRLRQLEV